MNKRILGTFLWFQVGWVVGSMATFFLHAPAGLDIVLASLVGAVVWWDPTHKVWPQVHASRTIRTPDFRPGQPIAAD